MMSHISKEHLAFMEEAKKMFEENQFQETYRNDSESFIALRMGLDRDCIMIYELGDYISNFTQQLKPVPIKKTHLGGRLNDKQ